MAKSNFYINIHADALASPNPNESFIQPVSELARLILAYYKCRDYSWPDFAEAIVWAVTEMGEAGELHMARELNRWQRNNPDRKEEYDPDRMGEELGDAIMMLMVAGLVSGVDPIACLVKKLEDKSDGVISILR
jgi:hypothetical protein